MSTIDYIKAKASAATEVLDAKGLNVAIAVAEWNSSITMKLLDGAVSTLESAGAESVKVMYVPGTFELTNAAARLRQEEQVDAVIVIGCVVRGDTPHFDYICQGTAYGISYLNATEVPRQVTAEQVSKPQIKPVIFCVLTTENMQQAEERAGGSLGNKGAEAAEAVIKMCRPVCIVRK